MRGWRRVLALLGWSCAEPVAAVQPRHRAQADPRRRASCSAQRRASRGEIVREIDDPHTGDRWLLVRDASHPGGPGGWCWLRPIASNDDRRVGGKRTGRWQPASSGARFFPLFTPETG